jgi:hypothetical protein
MTITIDPAWVHMARTHFKAEDFTMISADSMFSACSCWSESMRAEVATSQPQTSLMTLEDEAG